MLIRAWKRAEKTVPMNIGVPISLRQRIKEHQEINWSAVACRAFKNQLQAQDVLEQFAEEEVSDQEAMERALLAKHSRKRPRQMT